MSGKSIALWVGAVFLAIVGLVYFTTATNVATAPGRVANEALKTSNIIGNYEAFFDKKAGYDTRVAQINELKAQLATETGSDRRYTQTDLSGARQMCRSLAQQYNADSQKLNRGTFKSQGLPETLDANACEA